MQHSVARQEESPAVHNGSEVSLWDASEEKLEHETQATLTEDVVYTALIALERARMTLQDPAGCAVTLQEMVSPADISWKEGEAPRVRGRHARRREARLADLAVATEARAHEEAIGAAEAIWWNFTRAVMGVVVSFRAEEAVPICFAIINWKSALWDSGGGAGDPGAVVDDELMRTSPANILRLCAALDISLPEGTWGHLAAHSEEREEVTGRICREILRLEGRLCSQPREPASESFVDSCLPER